MAHIVHQRLLHALSTLNKDLGTVAQGLDLTTNELEGVLEQESLMPFSVLTNVCNAAGICRDYVLINKGPITPVIKTPLEPSKRSEGGAQKTSGIEAFIERLSAVLDVIPLNDREIGEAIGLSKVSVGRWRVSGMISEENLKAVCEMEGFDYEWVKTGVVDTVEAQDTYNRVYSKKLSDIDEQIAHLQKQKEMMQSPSSPPSD